MSNENLSLENAKPCPFCGGKEPEWGNDGFWRFVVCLNVDCMTEGPNDLGQSGALDKWNTRAGAHKPIDLTPEDVKTRMAGLGEWMRNRKTGV